MTRKLAVKRLTASDLTFFEWHFRNHSAGNQKSVNLNADVFIDILYPSIPDLISTIHGKIPLDLFIYGPGTKGEYNLQRKIVKQPSYKNYRLNGEFVANPLEDPERFNELVPGDIAIFSFIGEVTPTSARMVLLARNNSDDTALHGAFDAFLGTGTRRMAVIELPQLVDIMNRVRPREDHPINELNLDADLEDAARGGEHGLYRLSRRPSGRRVSRSDLYRARENTDRIGDIGEAVADSFLRSLQAAGQVTDYRQVSLDNAVSPYDFEINLPDGTRRLVDAKSTEGEFDRAIHISINELRQMAEGAEEYDLFRVYQVNETQGKIRVSRNMRDFARMVLSVMDGLPPGVSSDGISVRPAVLPFEDAVHTVIMEADESEP